MTESPYRTALPALQGRSQRTLEAILGAVEELLETHRWDDLSMAEIAERAGCAVGTVYARLPNKQAVLPCLLERYAVDFDGRVTEFLASRDWTEVPLEQRVPRRFGCS